MKYVTTLSIFIFTACGVLTEPTQNNILSVVVPISVSEETQDAPSCFVDKYSENAELRNRFCTEYTKFKKNDVKYLKKHCEGENGLWGNDGCNRANAVFGCGSKRTIAESGQTVYFTNWYYAESDAVKYNNKTICTEGVYAPKKLR